MTTSRNETSGSDLRPGHLSRTASPRLSVGLPVFNGERFLAATIDSILSQSFTDIELIISDNCSTDGTQGICVRFAEQDVRVRYHRNVRNLGAPENYNTALRLSRGELFKWSSCSDVCGSNVFALCIAALDANPEAVLSFPKTYLFEHSIDAAQEYDDHMNLMHDSPYDRFRAVLEDLGLNNAINGVIRRSVLASARPQGPYFASDVVQLAELALRGKFIQVEQAHLYRRMSPDSTAVMRSAADLRAHMTPDRRSPLRFQNWRHLIGLCSAVARVRPGLTDSSRAIRFLLRRARYSRRELFFELFSAS